MLQIKKDRLTLGTGLSPGHKRKAILKGNVDRLLSLWSTQKTTTVGGKGQLVNHGITGHIIRGHH